MFTWHRGSEEDEEQKAGETKEEPSFLRSFASTFGVVFLAEWGDLTQLGTAALAARYNKPLTVFLGATLALWSVAAIAVFIGHKAGKLLHPDHTKKIAALIFVLLGLALICDLL